MGRRRTRKRGSKLHIAKTGGSIMEDPRQSDLVIVVLGQTGAGKSTFINAVVGKTVACVGHGLRSMTQEVQGIILEHPAVSPSHRIILLDTPGFDNTSMHMEDKDIVARISHWLTNYYKTTINLAGVIYLLEITQAKEEEKCRKNLEKLAESCGAEVRNTNIVFATTKWRLVARPVGERRERQLKQDCWAEMTKQGSTVLRFQDTQESAWAIVNHILESSRERMISVDAVQIQGEMVEVEKLLAETEEVRTLQYTLQESLDAQKQIGAQMRKEGGEGEDMQFELLLQENEDKIRSTLNQIRGLKVPLSRRIMAMFMFGL